MAAGAEPEASLWPALDIEREAKAAGAWSTWFTRFLRKTAGMMDPTKHFHSVGRTFTRMARDAGLQEEMHDA